MRGTRTSTGQAEAERARERIVALTAGTGEAGGAGGAGGPVAAPANRSGVYSGDDSACGSGEAGAVGAVGPTLGAAPSGAGGGRGRDAAASVQPGRAPAWLPPSDRGGDESGSPGAEGAAAGQRGAGSAAAE